MSGRGFGKTRTGAEWIRKRVKQGARHIVFAGPTAADVRDVMVRGESGILAISPKNERPLYEPSKRRLTWPSTGAEALLVSADEPERFRGLQSDTIWSDELAAWHDLDAAWSNMMFGFRLGDKYGVRPRACVTTTPRPKDLIRALLKRSRSAAPDVVVSTGSTYDNRVNLSRSFFDQVVRPYEGTRLGRQELHAELLDDAPGALWKRDDIERDRVGVAPELRRIVVAIDPAVSTGENSAETGIVVAAIGENGQGYVLDDISGKYSPDGWGRRAVSAYERRRADRIIGEVNNGGDMVGHTIRTVDENVPFSAVHASRGKRTRAEPVSALYEQKRIHHVGSFPELEDQMCSWDAGTGERSPDRMDALVWAITELMITGNGGGGIEIIG